MPYIITTTKPETYSGGSSSYGPGYDSGSVTRLAAATIEEAQSVAWAFTFDADPTDSPGPRNAIDDMPESGCTVGPLPDGTTITVERVGWMDLERPIVAGELPGIETFDSDDYRRGLIDAYNARHGS